MKQALNISRRKHMPPDTEKYSYQLFTSTNVCSINLLHSLLGQHSTAGSSMLSVINPFIEVLAHTYVLDICIFQHTTIDVHH